MTTATASPRLRVFAGPNGSGKSTIQDELRPEWIGIYLNADEIEKVLRQHGQIDLSSLGVQLTKLDIGERLRAYFRASPLLQNAGLSAVSEDFRMTGSLVTMNPAHANSYVASVLADFVRRELLATGTSFTFETVMSSRDKVDFMREAQARGFRTYLYFVATEDPAINIARVQQRVTEGGHDVPHEKIVQRYARSIGLLESACDAANRAYVFDNSGEQHRLIAEVTDGKTLELHADTLPQWFIASSLWRAFQPGTPDATAQNGNDR